LLVQASNRLKILPDDLIRVSGTYNSTQTHSLTHECETVTDLEEISADD